MDRAQVASPPPSLNSDLKIEGDAWALVTDVDQRVGLYAAQVLGRMGFKGLVLTDALNMGAVAQFAPDGEVELAAFLAGNDMLLMPKDFERAKRTLVRAYRRGDISELRLAASVRKILMAKYKAGLHQRDTVAVEHIVEDLRAPRYEVLREELVEASLTVLRNDYDLVPVRRPETRKMAYVGIGAADGAPF